MKNLITLFLLTICTIAESKVTDNPVREFRGAWFPTVVNTTWKDMSTDEIKKDIISYLDLFKSLNMNAVIFQVRPQADALFYSELEPWSRFLTGVQGKESVPFFDPAEFITEECHKRGMEMHAWFNPYRVSSNSNEVLSPNHLYFRKPYLFVFYGNQIYFDPGEPESREHTVKVVSDFVKRYDVDAVHFDDYFYPYRIPFRDFNDDNSFKKYHEKDGFDKFDKDNWRRNNVNILIKTLNDTIKSIKPWVKFGISPFGVWRNRNTDPDGSDSNALQTNYDDLFADVLHWTRNRWIDYNAPQLYWEIGHPRADYLSLIRWWSKNKNGVNLYIGQSIWNQLEIKNRFGDIVNQLHRKMKLVREDPEIDGNIWWSGLGLKALKNLADSLKLNYQSKPALMPLYKHIDTIPPKKLKSLQYKNGTISWEVFPENDIMNTPFYYVIYLERATKDGADLSRNNIHAIVKEKRFRIKLKKGERITVTVLDRLQNESDPVSFILK